MDTGQVKQEQTIKEQTEGLLEELKVLVNNIDNLEERNPKSKEGEKSVEGSPDNVFDEILFTLSHCKGLAREAKEKVQDGISRKVH